MLKSKLNATKYPTVPYAELKKYLSFAPGIKMDDIDPIFLGRLAAWAKSKNQKLTIISGTRTLQKQMELYIKSGGKQLPDGSWTGGNGKVAKPGKSWHNFALAVDVSDLWAKSINKIEATAKQAELQKFGIFKPMTKGNGMTVLEDWHIQPIETLNVPVDKRKNLMPI